jgi:Tol biopolymer transport system component
LTISDGLHDGPDYSSDGKYISILELDMQIWRMQSDGTNQEQLTLMIIQIGFAHPSPDNKWIASLHTCEAAH